MRIRKSYPLENTNDFRNRLLAYSSQFSRFCFLDSCYNKVYGEPEFDYLLAAGSLRSIELNSGNAFNQIKIFFDENKDWFFGYWGYDLKNEIEKLQSDNVDHIGFSDTLFFIPEIIVKVKNQLAEIMTISDLTETKPPDLIFYTIANTTVTTTGIPNNIQLIPRIDKADYITTVEKIRAHIVEGDIYEMNFCQEFYSENVVIEPLNIFNELCKNSKAPYSVLFRWDNKYLISASPELFLKKNQNTIISKPIKGTINRGVTAEQDETLKNSLFNSEKDRAENVMIVDLVRNDITKSAKTGTIKVDELFGIYTFEHVHQMVSTVSAELKEEIHLVDILRNTFPMGSMTGAPKVMSMQLIEFYEKTKRGLFSGSFGYITPYDEFEFNVVIRSILYNDLNKYLSVQVGGAVVYDSDPEKEYEECLLKLEGIKHILTG